MAKKIVFSVVGVPHVLNITPALFDPNSRDREMLACAGTTFQSDEEVIAWVRAKDVPPDAEYVQIVSDDKLPDMRFFYAVGDAPSAWVVGPDGVDVDMVKARDIHRERLRNDRAPELAKLDVDYLRAVEADDEAEKKRIVGQKQALRDVTKDPAIEQAITPEELAAVAPAALKELA